MLLVTAFACGVMSFVSLSYRASGQGSSVAWKSAINSCFNAASCAYLNRREGFNSHICKPKVVLQSLYSVEKGVALGMHLPRFNLQHLKHLKRGFSVCIALIWRSWSETYVKCKDSRIFWEYEVLGSSLQISYLLLCPWVPHVSCYLQGIHIIKS